MSVNTWNENKREDLWRFPFKQDFRKFQNENKWYRNFPGKFPENPEIVEFPKKRTIQQKIPEILGGKANGAEISSNEFS